jgi:hypothetical protein
VDFVLGLFAESWSLDDILAEYPTVTREGVAACLELAAETLSRERFFSLSIAERVRILADECVLRSAVLHLRASGHDVKRSGSLQVR